MQHRFVSQTGSRRVILFFAGWAMDAAPFEGLRRPGYDIAVFWDYRDLYQDWSILKDYDEVCLVAWSFGVYAASVALAGIERRITLRIAINGTLAPVDRLTGIPPRIFQGTLDSLNERNLYKFNRRMCGSSEAFAAVMEHAPKRNIDELRDELKAMNPVSMFAPDQIKHWDVALISTDDAIVPCVNQWRAWQHTTVRMLEGYHLVDFQRILDHFVIDKVNMGECFERGFKSYDRNADVQRRIVELMEMLARRSSLGAHIALPGARVLEIGSGTGSLSRIVDAICGPLSYFEMWDIAGRQPVEGRLRAFKCYDAETAIRRVPACSFDCVVSASTIQWFNSPKNFLHECCRVLAPGGYMLLSTFVEGNLATVAAASGRSLPLLSAREWENALPEGFEVGYFETIERTLRFDTPIEAFEHLRSTGVNSLGRSSQAMSMSAIIRRFPQSLDGTYRINYRCLVMLLRKILTK